MPPNPSIVCGNIAFVALTVLCLTAASAMASTLGRVLERDRLVCGINPELVGFAEQDSAGAWSGFDVDYCRAIAAAVLGDAGKAEFVPLAARDRFRELESGAIDVLVRDTSWTMARDTAYGITFAGVNYYNGIGFMVPRALGVTSALQLGGAAVCLESGSVNEVVVADYFADNDMTVTTVPVGNDERQKDAYEAGECTVYTGDLVGLYGMRLRLAAPEDHIVLPESLSKEPWGLAVARGDEAWLAIVRWVHFALVNAEELGVTSHNVHAMASSPHDDVRNLVGAEGQFGNLIGLPNDWAANAVSAVGNYGEIFDRNLGLASRLQIPRGLNQLWNRGGLQFAPAIR